MIFPLNKTVFDHSQEMLKHISKTLKSLPKSPKSLTTISHIHTRNKPLISNPAIDFILDDIEHLQSSTRGNNPTQSATETAESSHIVSSSIQISHQWPEWVELMEKLMKFGYFDGVRNPFRSGGLIDEKSWNRIRTACLNFARDRPDLMRDMEMIAGSGCPSTDRKVVNSGKRLRAHLGIDEGNVCSSCNLRGNCERAYMKAHGDEGGHTVDIMRFVFAYGLDHNKQFINKRIEEAIRRLTKDMVKFSKNKLAIDPSKRPPYARRSRTQQQEQQSTVSTIIHGGWSCSKCNFFNYAKNTRCLQCHTNPPKRQLSPGEWECDSCNYINFKRNNACLKCDHKRPKAFHNSAQLQLKNS